MRAVSKSWWLWAAVLLCAGDAAWAKTTVPRMPSPALAPGVRAGSALTGDAIRDQLALLLPGAEPGPGAPGSAVRPRTPAARNPASLPPALPRGDRPVVDLSDTRYVPLAQPFIPVLLDWFEALAADYGPDRMALLDRGLCPQKVARLMRVFASMRMHRDQRRQPGAAPAIGWCHLTLREDWGRCKAGEDHTLVLVATERGWFVVDPFTRRMRQLEAGDRRWVVDYIAM